jgi:hypothetical protein
VSTTADGATAFFLRLDFRFGEANNSVTGISFLLVLLVLAGVFLRSSPWEVRKLSKVLVSLLLIEAVLLVVEEQLLSSSEVLGLEEDIVFLLFSFFD